MIILGSNLLIKKNNWYLKSAQKYEQGCAVSLGLAKKIGKKAPRPVYPQKLCVVCIARMEITLVSAHYHCIQPCRCTRSRRSWDPSLGTCHGSGKDSFRRGPCHRSRPHWMSRPLLPPGPSSHCSPQSEKKKRNKTSAFGQLKTGPPSRHGDTS